MKVQWRHCESKRPECSVWSESLQPFPAFIKSPCFGRVSGNFPGMHLTSTFSSHLSSWLFSNKNALSINHKCLTFGWINLQMTKNARNVWCLPKINTSYCHFIRTRFTGCLQKTSHPPPSCMTWTQASDSAGQGSRLKCIFTFTQILHLHWESKIITRSKSSVGIPTASVQASLRLKNQHSY